MKKDVILLHISLSAARFFKRFALRTMLLNLWIALMHGGLLPLNAWKVGPPPRKIEMVYVPHSNEPDNRCLLELAMLLSS